MLCRTLPREQTVRVWAGASSWLRTKLELKVSRWKQIPRSHEGLEGGPTVVGRMCLYRAVRFHTLLLLSSDNK